MAHMRLISQALKALVLSREEDIVCGGLFVVVVVVGGDIGNVRS
jgi:hypothetical protein